MSNNQWPGYGQQQPQPGYNGQQQPQPGYTGQQPYTQPGYGGQPQYSYNEQPPYDICLLWEPILDFADPPKPA